MDHPPEYEYRVTYRLSGGRPNGALAASDEEHAARIAGTLRRWKGHEGIAIERRLAAPWHPVSEPDDAPLGDARVAVFDVTVTPPNTYSDQGSIGIDGPGPLTLQRRVPQALTPRGGKVRCSGFAQVRIGQGCSSPTGTPLRGCLTPLPRRLPGWTCLGCAGGSGPRNSVKEGSLSRSGRSPARTGLT